MEKWSTTSGTALAGIFALFVIKGWLPIALLGALAAGLAALGLRLKRRLFATLSDFHLANLTHDRLGPVIQACYVLGNTECRSHHAALTGLLERNPRPAITKAILHSLGRMQHNAVVPAVQKYLDSNREDIQVTAVKALQDYSGHQLNLVLLKTLRNSIRADMAVRLSVVRALTERLGRLAVPYLLEVVEQSTHPRIVSNTIEILGEIAHVEDDEDLMEYLVDFLDAKHDRRVRTNAIVALYNHDTHGTRAREAFDRLMTSRDPKELDAVAYIAGVLNLRGHEPFIWRRSEELNHQNTVLLVALLRLDNPRAPALLAHWVIGEDEAQADRTLFRLSAVPDARRAQVFHELVEHSPAWLDVALLRMRRSQRDFDFDRDLIREEARRLGLAHTEEKARNNPPGGDSDKKAS
jgi:HEAT repeat protein